MRQQLTLRYATELFLLDGESRRFTAATLEFYRSRFRLFLDWCDQQNVTAVSHFTHTIIRQYLAESQQRGLSGHYVHGHARAIRTLCNFMVREGLLDASPFDKVKMPRLPTEIQPALTEDEVRTVLRSCRYERDRAAVLFLLDSGVRNSELVALNVEDVADDGSVTVRQGKGQKDRVTYVTARTRKQLLKYFMVDRGGRPEPHEPLFISKNGGGRLTRTGLDQVFRRLQEYSGVEHCRPHALRRTFAIRCLRAGMNIHILARLMGHNDIAVLRQYLPLAEQDIADEYRKRGPGTV